MSIRTTAAIYARMGLIPTPSLSFGVCEGDQCFRDGCEGIIERHTGEGCSCHLFPPCGDCVEAREYCPECDWDGSEQIENINGYVCKIDPKDPSGAWLSWKPRPLDPRKIDYRITPHSNSSQLCTGVYPETATRADVEKLVKGTFGGRFTKFRNGEFEYVAYTD